MITMIHTGALNCYSEDNWDKGSKKFDLVDMSGGFWRWCRQQRGLFL